MDFDQAAVLDVVDADVVRVTDDEAFVTSIEALFLSFEVPDDSFVMKISAGLCWRRRFPE